MITDRTLEKLYSMIDEKFWYKAYNEYRLHHTAAEILIDRAETLNLAIVAIETYRTRPDGLLQQDDEYSFDFDSIVDIETWDEKVKKSIELHRLIIREDIRPNFKPEDKVYLNFYFDERGDLKLVK
jgi:hypothetical protein